MTVDGAFRLDKWQLSWAQVTTVVHAEQKCLAAFLKAAPAC